MNPDTRRHILHAALGLSLLVTLSSPAAPAGQLLEERNFRLHKDGRERVVFTVARAGMLVVRVRIKEPFPSTPVHILLEGPGGLRVERTGSAPLRLRYGVAGAEEPATWHASVVNVSKLADVTGKLTIELQDPRHKTKRHAAAEVETGGIEAGRQEPDAAAGTSASPPAADRAAEATGTGFTDGEVSYIDDRRLRVVCRDRNSDVSLRLDLDQGTGVLLLRSNHVFSFAARQTSDDRIEIRGSGQHPLYLDLNKQALYFASGETGTFCRVRIYRGGER